MSFIQSLNHSFNYSLKSALLQTCSKLVSWLSLSCHSNGKSTLNLSEILERCYINVLHSLIYSLKTTFLQAILVNKWKIKKVHIRLSNYHNKLFEQHIFKFFPQICGHVHLSVRNLITKVYSVNIASLFFQFY